jgi:hypothetical protein
MIQWQSSIDLGKSSYDYRNSSDDLLITKRYD